MPKICRNNHSTWFNKSPLEGPNCYKVHTKRRGILTRKIQVYFLSDFMSLDPCQNRISYNWTNWVNTRPKWLNCCWDSWALVHESSLEIVMISHSFCWLTISECSWKYLHLILEMVNIQIGSLESKTDLDYLQNLSFLTHLLCEVFKKCHSPKLNKKYTKTFNYVWKRECMFNTMNLNLK